ncbi:DUF5683 domain-containing protein [Riemerella anatipestifer]|uniref:DUF5683 domain-containing protein n=1 Tax=Riemerella anatipestifer TaxID=34085 RepID=UPI001BD92AF7|nr:DUF5683 domain-containing protein [Riemerella anatipestifer]MBT0548352.1 hypothetical protein [Riemerella anatipestifer]MBT0559115.1 hypothetical protein [Riemerella anatipestifer]
MSKVFSFLALLFVSLGLAQNTNVDTLGISKTETEIVQEIEKANANKPILKTYNPTLAGLYSAVLPGLGQYYNKKYWKIPIVWGAVGTSVGIAIWNQNNYERYRKAFVAELNNQPHEFSGISGVDATVLGNTQDRMKRQRDYAIAISVGIYILNIIDAVVDAHLHEQRNDPDLAIAPTLLSDQWGLQNGKLGVSLNYRF